MKYIIANFKMNQTPTETKQYLINLIPHVEKGKHNVVLCFPSTSLTTANYLLSDTDISLGAQNICDEEEGKCTGEVSGKMIKDAGATYVLIGHSERRAKFKENAKQLNKKIKIALKNRIKVIFCVGESLAEKNTLKTIESLKNQIEEAFKGLYENELENIVIAYEPIWAIGSGKTPTNKEIETSVRAIRKVITDDFSAKAGENMTVVYGGSVDFKNAPTIKKVKNLNGMLIGGACLDSDNFSQILREL